MIIKFPKKEVMDSEEDGQEVAPSVGDEIRVPAVMGVVDGEDGDMLVVKIKSIGSHECGDEMDSEGEDDASEDMSEVRNKLSKLGEE